MTFIPRDDDPYDRAFKPTRADDMIGVDIHVAVNPDTDEMIIHIPAAYIRVTQVVHEEGMLKLQMHRLDSTAP
jgi:hypothetical protein